MVIETRSDIGMKVNSSSSDRKIVSGFVFDYPGNILVYQMGSANKEYEGMFNYVISAQIHQGHIGYTTAMNLTKEILGDRILPVFIDEYLQEKEKGDNHGASTNVRVFYNRIDSWPDIKKGEISWCGFVSIRDFENFTKSNSMMPVDNYLSDKVLGWMQNIQKHEKYRNLAMEHNPNGAPDMLKN